MSASVTENNELQFFASTLNAPEGVELKGRLANGLDVSSGELVTMDDIDMSTVGGAQLSIGVIDAAIKYVDSHRSEIGGFQNRVSGTMDNLNTVNRSVTESKDGYEIRTLLVSRRRWCVRKYCKMQQLHCWLRRSRNQARHLGCSVKPVLAMKVV